MSHPKEGPYTPIIPFPEALIVWLKIGCLGFGGPAGQIAMMHRILVEEKRWISHSRFLHGLHYCMLLPGPEATQLAIYIGWLMHRTIGGFTAGLLFILPGFFAILLLSMLYASFHQMPAVQALFLGLKSAVLAIVIEAVLRIGKKSLHSRFSIAIAAFSFIAMFFFNVPFPLIIFTAALVGIAANHFGKTALSAKERASLDKEEEGLLDRALSKGQLPHVKPSLKRTVRIILFLSLLWSAPIIGCMTLLGGNHLFTEISLFFSKMAMVTFGGAYAVLSYVAQAAVSDYGWLTPSQMLDGLGMAETTPGPLIMVLEYVGFMAGYHQPGSLSPMIAGLVAAILTVWVTFVPCFLWIFAGAPYIEQVRHNRFVVAALSAITAAVVGVILHLASWFALHTLFAEVHVQKRYGLTFSLPEWSSLHSPAFVLAAIAVVLLFWCKQGMIRTLFITASLGVLYQGWIAS